MGISLRRRRTGASGAVGCGSNAEPAGRLKIPRRRHCEPAQRVWQSSFPNGVPLVDRFPPGFDPGVAMTAGASRPSPLFFRSLRGGE